MQGLQLMEMAAKALSTICPGIGVLDGECIDKDGSVLYQNPQTGEWQKERPQLPQPITPQQITPSTLGAPLPNVNGRPTTAWGQTLRVAPKTNLCVTNTNNNSVSCRRQNTVGAPLPKRN